MSEFYGADYDVIEYGPYELKRDLIWFVGRPNYTEGGYSDAQYFFSKEKAIAHMVKLQLEGRSVRW